MAPSTFALDYLNNVPIESGNTAKKIKQTPKTKQKVTVIPGTKTTINTLSKKSFLGMLFCIVALTVMLIFAVFLNARATSVKYDINYLINENTRLENEIGLVNTKIEAENSINIISNYALTELGLGTAKTNQYAIIDSSEVMVDLASEIKSRLYS